MDLPDRLLGPLTSAYWVIHSLPHLGRISAVEEELRSLGLLEVAIVGPDDDPLDRRFELRISDKGKRLVEENNILTLIEMGAFFIDAGDFRVSGLVQKVPKEQLPVLLASMCDGVRQAAKARLEDGVD